MGDAFLGVLAFCGNPSALTWKMLAVGFCATFIHGATFSNNAGDVLGVDVLGVDALGVDALGVDALGVDPLVGGALGVDGLGIGGVILTWGCT